MNNFPVGLVVLSKNNFDGSTRATPLKDFMAIKDVMMFYGMPIEEWNCQIYYDADLFTKMREMCRSHVGFNMIYVNMLHYPIPDSAFDHLEEK